MRVMTVAKTFRADAAEQFAPAAKTYRETGNAMHERSAASWGSIAHHAEQTAKKAAATYRVEN